MAQAHGQPWYPERPFWASLPDVVAAGLIEDYEEKAAKLEHSCLLPKALAEEAAYAFMSSDRPEILSPFVSEDEIARQLNAAKTIRRHCEVWERAYDVATSRPWVIQRRV